MDKERWHDTLICEGFSGLDMTLYNSEVAISVMVSTSPSDSIKTAPDQILIIEPDHPVTEIQALSHTIIECLRAMGSSASITTLE